jgi:hypothetical protein
MEGSLKYFAVGQREDVVLEVVRGEILDAIGQAGLVIDQQDGTVVFIETVVFERAHDSSSVWCAVRVSPRAARK